MASSTVAARAFPPMEETRDCKDSGPRELLTATSCPAFANSRAAVPPMFPDPMIPIFTRPSSRSEPETPRYPSCTPGQEQEIRAFDDCLQALTTLAAASPF
jgi:hypothetical protein